jgi:hypothetical protein
MRNNDIVQVGDPPAILQGTHATAILNSSSCAPLAADDLSTVRCDVPVRKLNGHFRGRAVKVKTGDVGEASDCHPWACGSLSSLRQGSYTTTTRMSREMKENNDLNAHGKITRSEPRWSLSAVCRIYHLTYQQQPQSSSGHVIYPVALPVARCWLPSPRSNLPVSRPIVGLSCYFPGLSRRHRGRSVVTRASSSS